MISGLIIGHRDFSRAIVDAVEAITGCKGYIEYISNEGLSTDELSAEIKAKCDKNLNENIVLFVDVYGGSCWRAAKKAKAPNVHIVTGLNLPMLLSFVRKRETVTFEDMPAVMETDGKRAIMKD